MPYDRFGNFYPTQTQDPMTYGSPRYNDSMNGPSNTPPGYGQYGYANQLQQYTGKPQETQQQSPPPLNGRLINEERDILPKEIPMDGSVSVFPKSDFSYILAKAWNANGTIDTVKFIPDIPAAQPQTSTDTNMQQILDKLNKMEETLSKLDKELNG